MAADFIESQDGNIYLRLTGNTTQVYFNAASEAANTYTMTIAGLNKVDTGGLLHIFNDDISNTGEPAFFDGYGFVNANDHALVQPSGPATFYIFNPGSEGGNASFRADNSIDQDDKWFLTISPGDSVIGSIDEMINEGNKYYTVNWNNPFPSDQYNLTITIDTNMSASGINVNTSAVAGIRKRADGFDVGFCSKTSVNGVFSTGYVRQFSASATAPFSISKNGGVNDPSYVGTGQVITAGGSGTRYYLVTGVNQNGTQYTTTNENNFLCLGNTVLKFQNNTIAYPGTPKDKNLFVKHSGNWKASRNIFVKYQNAWRQCEKVWVKSGGVWKESYVRNSSDYVNMLELYDDALDFAVQVVAQN